jgi:phosphate transport system protein
MSIKKDKKFDKLHADFNKMKLILQEQFKILEDVVSYGLDIIDTKRIELFKENEDKLDKLEIKMSDTIILTMGLQQPMASELRLLIAYFRMIGFMERIGDQLNNVITFMQKMEPPFIHEKHRDSLMNMLSISENMVRKALISFEDNDKEYAIWTIKNDELVDEMKYELMKRTVKKDTPEGVDVNEMFNLLNYGNILSSIERVADNATNIAEASIYYQQGIDLRHKNLSEDDQL